ncbi:head-tail connector protein [Latilactobacillus sakei]|uniref:head-tail connector protein n=1 Tax=Latilactobacillus sakei TaxID=1599 RepID=UPI000A791FB4
MDDLVSRLKTSLRIDGTEEDPLLYGYATAAQLFVKNAIATDDKAFLHQNQSNRYLKWLCCHWLAPTTLIEFHSLTHNLTQLI